MIKLNLTDRVHEIFAREARRRRVSRSTLIERALAEYAQDLEDAREILRQRRARASGREKSYPLEQIAREFGVRVNPRRRS